MMEERYEGFMFRCLSSRIFHRDSGNRRKHLEKNISAEQRLQKKDAWIQDPHENEKRTPDSEKKTGQRKKTSDSLDGKTDLRFPRSIRIRSRADYIRAQNSGKRIRGRYLILLTIGNDLSTSRFGVTVSKKNGNAAKRNRIKRRIREIQRLNRYLVPPGRDVIVIAKREASEASFEQMKAEYNQLIRRADLTKRES